MDDYVWATYGRRTGVELVEALDLAGQRLNVLATSSSLSR
jgi:hypothetical protein